MTAHMFKYYHNQAPKIFSSLDGLKLPIVPLRAGKKKSCLSITCSDTFFRKYFPNFTGVLL